MITRQELMRLRKQKAKLLKLSLKRRRALALKNEMLKEEQKLKREIAELKAETKKGFIANIRRGLNSPQQKERIKKGKKILKNIDKFIRKIPS